MMYPNFYFILDLYFLSLRIGILRKAYHRDIVEWFSFEITLFKLKWEFSLYNTGIDFMHRRKKGVK